MAAQATATTAPRNRVNLYDPHPGQQLIHNSTARFRVASCGVRWGKDALTAPEAVRLGAALFANRQNNPEKYKHLKPMVNVWLVAPHLPELRQLWREFLSHLRTISPYLEAQGCRISNNKAERIITISKGGYEWLISGKSADRPETLVAEGLDLLVIDEAREIKAEAWNNLVSRVTDREGIVIIIGTPGSKKDFDDPREPHWYYEVYNRGLSPDYPEYESWNFPTAYWDRAMLEGIINRGGDDQMRNMAEYLIENRPDNPYGNPYYPFSEFARAFRELPRRNFDRDFLAQFQDFQIGEGVYAGEYSRDAMVGRYRHLYNPASPLYCCWDWGWRRPACLILQMTDDDRIVALGERMGHNVSEESFIFDVVKFCEAYFPNPSSYIDIGDIAGNATESTSGITCIDEFKIVMDGLLASGRIPHPRSIRSRANTEQIQARARDIIAKRMKPRHDGVPGLLVDESCVILIDGFAGGYQLSDKTYTRGDYVGGQKPLKDGYFDHLQNCLEFYAMNELDVLGRVKRSGDKERLTNINISRDEYYGDA